MKSRINYTQEFNALIKSAENELREVLEKLPNRRYQYISDEAMDKVADDPRLFIGLDAPVVTIINRFDNSVNSIYVESVFLLENGVVQISGFDDPSFESFESRNYRLSDIVNCDFDELFNCIK